MEPTKTDMSAWLPGGGEMGERVRRFDWSKTPLGPVVTWSPALRMMSSFLLANRFPLLLWWGPEYISIYNDAYRPVLGDKHPWALGRPVRECWSEIWHVLRPLIDTPFNGGPATWNDDISLEINRHGFLEETHFTIAYSPVPDESVAGGIGGVLATVHEITEKVVGERRITVLRDLAKTTEAQTAEEVGRLVAKRLAAHPADIPFALLYFIDSDGKRARLAGCAGADADNPACPAVLDLSSGNDQIWPVAETLRSQSPQIVENLSARLVGSGPPGPWSDPPREAVVLPIRSSTAHQPAGVLVAGVSPRLRLDEPYRNFFDLVAGQIAMALANAQAHEAERQRAEALADLDRTKMAFYSNISHEFRTPLTLMLGPLEDALASPVLSADERNQLDLARRNSLRLLQLVNTLLDFSRIEAGRLQAAYQPIDLSAATIELAGLFGAAIEKGGIRLVVDCPPLPEPAWVDREMWEKIVLNLISNAFKFTHEGEIEIRLRSERDSFVLSVRDTGVGIPSDELPRLFERFYRGAGTHGRTHEGSGIGLALVQELVKLHRGTVSVESEVGRGTVFTVTLPAGRGHLPEEQISKSSDRRETGFRASHFADEVMRWLPDAEHGMAAQGAGVLASQSPSVPNHGERARIMVVDDNADMRGYLHRLLASHYEVDAVCDGEAALAAITHCKPDLILSDVMLPRLDGVGLLRKLRADPVLANLPIILLSARAGEDARIEGIEAGADDYLTKPFSARELLARIDAQVRLSRLRQDADRSIRESEARLRLATEAANVGAFDWNIATGVNTWTPELEAMYGLAPGEFGKTQKSWEKLLHPDDRVEAMAKVEEALATGNPIEHEWRVKWDDGSVHWIYGKFQAFKDKNGKPVRLTGVNTDISARKKAEQDLLVAHRQLQGVIDNSAAMVYAFDRQGRIVMANAALAKVLKSTPDQMIGRTRHHFMPKADADWHEANDREVFGKREAKQFEEYSHLEDQTITWLTTKFPLWDAEGQIYAVAGISTDISDRKQIEDARARLAAIVAFSNEAIISKTLDGKVTSWNRAAERMFGYAAEEMIGSSIRRIVPADRQSEEDDILARINRGEQLERYETVRICKGGHKIDVSVTISPIFDRAGKIIGASKIAHDITDKKRAEEREHLLMREVNHRAKNLLSLVQSMARQTAATNSQEFVEKFARRIQGLAASQDVLVNSGWHDVPLDTLIRSQLLHFGDLIGQRILLSGPPLNITAASAQAIGLAFHELATNAAKYGALSNDTGIVRIVWSILDAGGEQRFTLSWREEAGPPVSKPTQHGFGSAVTEQLVKMSLDGEVETNYAADGLKWCLSCSAEKIAGSSENASVQATLSAPVDTQSSGPRVLVVEDEPLIALEIAAMVREGGFEVLGPVGSVKQALAIVEKSGCDAALLDVNLGSETAEPIASLLSNSGVPFVTISGYSLNQLPSAFGTAPLLSKPLKSDEVIRSLNRCLRMPAA